MATKAKRIEIRLSEKNKHLIEDAAALCGQSVSAFLVAAGLDAAREFQTTDLSRRDWVRFLEIMDRDEQPTPALIDAVKK